MALNVRLSRKKPRDVLELSDLCIKHNTLDLYLWLSIRFPAFFVEQEVCKEQKAFAIDCIQGSLESPHLQHKFSHSNSYQVARVKMLTGHGLGLPSLSYGEVRESYLKNMKAIDDADLYTFPTLEEENQVMGYVPPPRQFSKDASAPRRVRDDVQSRSSALPIGLRGGPPPVSDVDRPKVDTEIFRPTNILNHELKPNNPLTANKNKKNIGPKEKPVVAIPFRRSGNVVVDKFGKKVYRAAEQTHRHQPNTPHEWNRSSKPTLDTFKGNRNILRPVGLPLMSKLASEVSSS